MKWGSAYSSVFLTIMVLMVGNPAVAEVDFSAELGIDLENNEFVRSLKDTTQEFSITRSISNHYLNLRLTGPLVTKEFASFSTQAKVFGTYYQARGGDTGENNEYFEPSLPTYEGRLSLFPQRRYPLEVFYGKLRSFSIRYEPNNRSQMDYLKPELTIIRRYKTDMKSRGAMWKLALAENAELKAEYRREDVQVQRSYDFGEDRDIWVSLTTLRLRPTDPTTTIHVENTIATDTVLLFIDLQLVDSLAPGTVTFFPLDSGQHEVEFVPRSLNAYRTRIEVRGDMLWRIVYNPPPSPGDLAQKLKYGLVGLRVGGKGKLRSEGRYAYSATDDEVQGLSTTLNSWYQNTQYSLSDLASILVSTAYNRDNTTVDTISSQFAETLMQNTSLSWGQKRGLQVLLAHSLTKSSTTTDDTEFKNSVNNITNQFTYPLPRYGLNLKLVNGASFQSDDRGSGNKQFSSELSTNYITRLGRLKLEPKNVVTYSYSKQKNPSSESDQVQVTFSLLGELPRVGVLGDLRFQSSFDWRRRGYETGYDIRKRVLIQGMLLRKIGHAHRIMLMTNHEKEFSGGGGPEAAALTTDRPLKQFYKVDLQVTPVKTVSLAASGMWILQGAASISRYGGSAAAKLPFINVPVKSFITTETRVLEGLGSQRQLSLDNEISYRFRQVVLTIKHRFMMEDLLREKYHFQEILGKVTRTF